MCAYNNKILQLALSAMLTLLPGIAQATSYVDVLDLPAKPSALALRSPLLDVTRAGERLVSVGQRGHILYSDDAGQSWLQAQVPVSVDLNAVHFPTPQQGWAVGNDGVILHSSDAGATWSKQLDGRKIGELVLKYYSALAAAEPANEQWATLAGEGQRLLDEGADKPFLDVWFADERMGYAVGVFNLILHTRDGGRSWIPFQDRTDNPQGLHLNALGFTGDALYIAGEQGLLRKWDSILERFIVLETPYQGSFFGITGKPGEVLVYGLRGHALHSRDGGYLWQNLSSELQISFCAALVDAQGRYRLFTQAGHQLLGSGEQTALRLLPQTQQTPVAGAVQAANGALILVGARGVRSLPAE